MKKDLAICIPTYKRVARIREYLDLSIDALEELGIDVYIYDSSDDNDTKRIVDSYSFKYKNLYLVTVSSSIPSNVKIYDIWSDNRIIDKYNYVWIMGDSLRWSQYVYKRVSKEIKKSYHMIIANLYDFQRVGIFELFDKQEIFEQYAHLLTLYGSCIISTEKFIKGTNWNYLKEKYCNKQCMGFSQIGFIFERLAQIRKPHVLNLCCLIDHPTISSKVEVDNHWRKKDFFNVFLNQWVNTIYSLPDCYMKKSKVIKMYEYYTHFINLPALIRLRKEGSYGIDTFIKYYFRWRKCTVVPRWALLKTAIIPINRLTDLYDPRNILFDEKEREICDHMLEFVRRFDNVYLFGAGRIANNRISFLEKKGVFIEKIFVSEIGEATSLSNIPIERYNPASDIDGGIIFCMSGPNMNQVIRSFFLDYDKEKMFTEYVCSSNEIRNMTDFLEYIDPGKFTLG